MEIITNDRLGFYYRQWDLFGERQDDRRFWYAANHAVGPVARVLKAVMDDFGTLVEVQP